LYYGVLGSGKLRSFGVLRLGRFGWLSSCTLLGVVIDTPKLLLQLLSITMDEDIRQYTCTVVRTGIWRLIDKLI